MSHRDTTLAAPTELDWPESTKDVHRGRINLLVVLFFGEALFQLVDNS